MIAKLIRFIRNPSPYLGVIRDWILEKRLAILAYHYCWQPLVLRKLRKRNRVRIAFMAMNLDMWRYDGLYKLLSKDSRYYPVIVTAPNAHLCLDEQLSEQRKMLSVFRHRGYEVLPGYDEANKRWIGIDQINPDIIFYTQPYDGVVHDNFSWRHNLSKLFCYAPYSFQLSKVRWNWDNTLQNYCVRHYITGGYQQKICREMSRVRALNTRLVGYCIGEEIAMALCDRAACDGAWRNDSRKRVIWAPHHSICEQEWFKCSSFLEICDTMVELREKYRKEIVFAFKPHPLLYSKLCTLWGQEKTDVYYAGWRDAENAFDATGSYQALFAGSDAMIHCSGSFIVEYLYVNKPVMYVYSRSRNCPDLGEIGEGALAVHFPGWCNQDIERFVRECVLDGKDSMKSNRQSFLYDVLRHSDSAMFSKNVYTDLNRMLHNE